MAITYGAKPAREVRAQTLVTPRMFPVASPTFLARRGPFDRPEQLLTQALLHEQSRDEWRQWFAAAGVDPVPHLPGPRLWYADVTIEAALQGQGVALANQLLVSDELAAGRLSEIFATDIRFEPYSLQAPSARWHDPSMRKLRRWLTARLTAEEAGERVVP
jgi:LysR family transcriptional regulator, glycine cleavage system transcriptional activator